MYQISMGVAGRATICFQYASDIAAVTPKKFIAIAIRQLYYPGVYYPIDSLVYCFQNKVRHASDLKSLAYSYIYDHHRRNARVRLPVAYNVRYTAKLVQTDPDMIFPSFRTKCVNLPVSGMIAIANLVQIFVTVCDRMYSHSGTYLCQRVAEWCTYKFQTVHIVYQSWVIFELCEQIHCFQQLSS